MTEDETSCFEIHLDPDKASESVKPNSTITRRQKQLLNQMADSRFASRSEALRAAIEGLRERLEGDGTRAIDELRLDVQSLESSVEELGEEIETIHSALISPQINSEITQVSGNKATLGSRDSRQSNCNRVADTVHKSMIEVAEPTLETLVDHSELSTRQVHRGLMELEKRELIVFSETDTGIEYRLASFEGNSWD
ncbi:hypothetical protein [Natrarchaeobius halalkaliphilus]|uniref:hypothetical protein n=1 Tax=Natrarchaeobius halalkaliphilus TaxID=1679091 RepID=UPI000F540DB0|nr:hypothetical protein [Natrarchaeobius halalkaliphilus]